MVPGRAVRDRVPALGRRLRRSPGLPQRCFITWFHQSPVIGSHAQARKEERCTLYVADGSPFSNVVGWVGDACVLGFLPVGRRRFQLLEVKAWQGGTEECSGISDLQALQLAFQGNLSGSPFLFAALMLLLLLLRWLLVNRRRLHKGDQFLETWEGRVSQRTHRFSGDKAQGPLGEVPQDKSGHCFHFFFFPQSEF